MRASSNGAKQQSKAPLRVAAHIRVKPAMPGTLCASNSLSTDGTGLSGPATVIGPQDGQQVTYDKVARPLVDLFVGGTDCTLFAYGQTGSGKTYTLLCPPGGATEAGLRAVGDGQVPDGWGLFPRAVLDVLHLCSGATLTASVYEVYLDQCYDLQNGRARITVAGNSRASASDGTCDAYRQKWLAKNSANKAGGASNSVTADSAFEVTAVETDIRGAPDVARLVRLVEAARTAKAHALNDRSSRSHCVVTLTLCRGASRSRFLFVDLAGSERITRTKVVGLAQEEAKNINTSLTALGRCITALGTSGGFVPFRDSVLTMLLKDSLVGCARASVVVTVSQDATSEKETAASLRFAARCAEVRGVVRARSEPEDPRKLEATLRVQLNAVYTAMREMAAQGMAGGEDASASLASRQLFRSSKARLDAASAEALIARQNLVELAASGHGAASRSAAQQRQQRAEEQIRIQKGVLARMAHSGLWRGARPVYLTKQAEAIALRRRLQQLTGNDSAVPHDVVFADAHMTVQHMCSQ